MPNSGTVTAGSVALASQYNNLRSDVLDASTGHTHTGAADAGARIEGTALKSTGATVGYVLTAGTGGTATTWAPAADAGAFATASIAFSFASANDTTVKYTLGTAVNHAVGVGGAGTTLLTVADAADGTAHTYRTFSIPAHTANATVTAFATATIGAAPAGGTITGGVTYIPNNNQASSTSVYWLEFSRRDGLYREFFRKYTQNLATNQWSTEIGYPNSSYFGEYKGLKYIPAIGAWITGFNNIYQSTGTSFVQVINDVSGSVYQANFMINGSGIEWYITDVVYIPPTGAGDGTIYAFGTSYSGNQQRIVTYTAGSASISAAATATSFAAKNIPSPAGTTIMSAYWDSTIEKLVVVGTNNLDNNSGTQAYNYYQFDRAFSGSAASTSVSYGTTTVIAQQRFGNYAFGYVPQSSSNQRNSARIGYFGAAGTGYAPVAELLPTGSTATNQSHYFGDLTGVQIAAGGTLTAYLDSRRVAAANSGTATSYPIARKRAATASIGTASTGRMIWGASTAATVVSTTADGRITMDGNLAYLPAGSIITQVATDATATGTVSNTFYTIGLK